MVTGIDYNFNDDEEETDDDNKKTIQSVLNVELTHRRIGP